MRVLMGGVLIVGLGLAASIYASQTAGPQAAANMQELMTRIIQPTSDSVFYISRNPPGTDAQWRAMEQQTLMLAESANLLLIPGYKEPGERWLEDVMKMRDASLAAFEAAKARDMDTLIDLNNDLYMSCESCHDAVAAP